jgi:hypothetical protein
MRGGKLRFAGIVFGCCLGTALTGCVWHRSDGWLADQHILPRFSPSPTSIKDSVVAHRADHRSTTESKPELLPWRSRLKGYHLGARLARDRNAVSEQSPTASVEKKTPSPISTRESTRSMIEPDSFSQSTSDSPSLENGELRLPADVGSAPDRGCPDVVVE